MDNSIVTAESYAREQALRLAVGTAASAPQADPAKDIVRIAEAFYDFLRPAEPKADAV